MWPIKEKENKQLLILWPNLIPYSKLKECVVKVLLLSSIPLLLPNESTFFLSTVLNFSIRSRTRGENSTFSTQVAHLILQSAYRTSLSLIPDKMKLTAPYITYAKNINARSNFQPCIYQIQNT